MTDAASIPAPAPRAGIAGVPAVPCRSLPGSRSPDWQPGRGDMALHSEIFASSRDGTGGAAALALALDQLRSARAEPGPLAEAEDRRAVLWVQERRAIRLTGRPYRPGLPEGLRHRLIHVEAENAQDVLFTLEEAVRCRDLAAVIGELAGNPRALDFTASRRLSLASERHGVPLFLVRLDAERDLSSARMRWEVASHASPRPRWNADAPGAPSWQAELFRARRHRPASFLLQEEEGGRLGARPSTGPGRTDFGNGVMDGAVMNGAMMSGAMMSGERIGSFLARFSRTRTA